MQQSDRKYIWQTIRYSQRAIAALEHTDMSYPINIYVRQLHTITKELNKMLDNQQAKPGGQTNDTK